MEKCPICYDELLLTKLDCQHSFCRECLQKLVENKDHFCPLCRAYISQGLWKDLNFGYNRIIEDIGIVQYIDDKIGWSFFVRSMLVLLLSIFFLAPPFFLSIIGWIFSIESLVHPWSPFYNFSLFSQQ